MDKLTGAWKKITSAFEKFRVEGQKTGNVMQLITDGFDTFVQTNGPEIDKFLKILVSSIENTLNMMLELNKVFKDSGVYQAFGSMIGGIAMSILRLVTGIAFLYEKLTSLYHFFFVGNSPAFLDVLEMLIDKFSSLGSVIMAPLQMISKLIPDTEVANSTFNRSGDMESVNSSLGDQIAMAVKEALQGAEMNNKVQLEVVSQNGLPTLFDFVQRGMDDSQAGRSPQHALNATRAGIGKA